jgi:hypothetical protein
MVLCGKRAREEGEKGKHTKKGLSTDIERGDYPIKRRTIEKTGRGKAQGDVLTSAERGVRRGFGRWIRLRRGVGFEGVKRLGATGEGRR